MKRQNRFATTIGMITLGAMVTSSCTKSSTPAIPGAKLTSLSAGTAALSAAVSNYTPRLHSDTGVAFNDRFSPHHSPYLKGLEAVFLSRAHATGTTGLQAVWSPASLLSVDGNLIMNNLYAGGNSACVYNGADLTDDTCTNGENTNESLQSWMGQAMNPNFVNSNGSSTTVFGRLNFATAVACTMGNLIPAAETDTDGLPAVGTHTITLPSDPGATVYQATSSGGCGMNTSAAGQSLTLTVTAVTGSSLFTKAMTGNSPGGGTLSLYMKLDPLNAVFNFMQVEDERSQGRYAAARTLATINGLKTSFEYIALGSPFTKSTKASHQNAWCVDDTDGQTPHMNQCGYEFYRIFLDQGADQGYLLSNYGSSDNTNYTRFSAAGKVNEINGCSGGANCGATISLSVGLNGAHQVVHVSGHTMGNNLATPNDFIGCVDAGSGSITTDDSLACDLTGTTVSAATAIDGERSVYIADVAATLLANSNASTTLSFSSGADIFTAVPSN